VTVLYSFGVCVRAQPCATAIASGLGPVFSDREMAVLFIKVFTTILVDLCSQYSQLQDGRRLDVLAPMYFSFSSLFSVWSVHNQELHAEVCLKN
jgi:hypothetical protein